jgi:hypothetical protein
MEENSLIIYNKGIIGKLKRIFKLYTYYLKLTNSTAASFSSFESPMQIILKDADLSG